MKINQRKAGALLSYIFTVTNAAVGFIYIPLLIYFLGQEEYGLYQLLGSFLIYLGLFDFGLGKTVTRYYSKYIALKDDIRKENLLALSTIIFSGLTIILIIVGSIFYFFLEELFKNSLTSNEIIIAQQMYIVILVTATITILTTIFKAIVTANEKFVFLKGLLIVQVIMRPIIVLAVFSIQASAFNLVIVQAAINILGIVAMVYYSFKKLNVRIKFHYWDISLLKDLQRFSFFIFITAVMDQIFWRSDQIILGIIVGTASVAVYSIGSQIVMYYMTLSTAMSGVFLPSITKRVAQNASNKELTDIFIKIGRLQYILLGAVLIGFILFGKEFISLWVGDDFTQAYYITLIIMLPFTIDLIQNIGLAILQAKNMYGFRASIFLGMALLNVAVSIPLAKYYGGIGTAAATGISFLIGNGLIMNIYYYKKVGLNIFRFWKEIFKLSIYIVFPFLIGYFIINQISLESHILTLIIKLSIFVLVYGSILWVCGMNKYEKDLFIRPIRKIINRIA
ncbi:oligosaccharide flippase family protein [Evansella clarkii]|uniref:oligosaccharide flippase family protein n=1 Tax=Evansella clarkii TaxID=79879 RepID=UPI0009971BCB|nr:oligosaccharide flippase family protein [Evansella clarkii]